MPVKVEITPPPPANSKQLGVTKTLLYNGSKFDGSQKSKGNSYAVEVVLQVSSSSPEWKAHLGQLRVWRGNYKTCLFLFVGLARRRRKFVSMWLPENYRTHI